MIFKGLFDFKNQSLQINWRIVLPILFFIFIGLMTLKSTSNLNSFVSSTFYKQILWVFLGSNIFIIMQYVRIQYLYDYSYLFFIFLIILLGLTFLSEPIKGAKSWFVLGPFYFQPSEFGKIIYAICLARFFSDNRKNNLFTKYIIYVLLISLVPPFLVFLQPDLGTAIIYLSIIIPIFYWSKFNHRLIFLLIAPAISVITVSLNNLFVFYIWMLIFIFFLIYNRITIIFGILNFLINVICGLSPPYIWDNVFKPHQKERVLTFFDPFRDALGAGYQVIQSWISIGSGGMWGKGLGNGTQTQLKFLPVKDTDFIISVIAEELGFFTIFFILFALIFFTYWVLEYLSKIESRFSGLLMVGLLSIIFMHIIINMAMVSGLLPVTGLPVPFISYGGSFFLSCSIIVGLINNIINNQI